MGIPARKRKGFADTANLPRATHDLRGDRGARCKTGMAPKAARNAAQAVDSAATERPSRAPFRAARRRRFTPPATFPHTSRSGCGRMLVSAHVPVSGHPSATPRRPELHAVQTRRQEPLRRLNPRPMNLPNSITISRIATVPLLIWILSPAFPPTTRPTACWAASRRFWRRPSSSWRPSPTAWTATWRAGASRSPRWACCWIRWRTS